jgi:hypothetical protein
MNIGLPGVHPNGEDGAFEYLDRGPIIYRFLPEVESRKFRDSREPGRRPGEPRTRIRSAADPETGSAENRLTSCKAAQPDFGCAACHSGGAFQQPLCFTLKLQTRVLMRLSARQR